MKKKSILVTVAFLVLFLSKYSYAQVKIGHLDRAKYAEVGYVNLGFGEVNRKGLTDRQVVKINRRLEALRKNYGVVVVFASQVPEEAQDWKAHGNPDLIKHYLGLDPRVARNHVGIQFEEISGHNQIQLGSHNGPYLDSEKEELSQEFVSHYDFENAFPSMKRTLRSIERVYRNLDDSVKEALRYPKLNAGELFELGVGKMDWLNDLESAVDDFTQATVLNPNDARVYMRLGYAYTELENEKAAQKTFQRAWSLKPSFATALGFLTYYYRNGEPQEVSYWKERMTGFKSDYEEKLKNVARYGGFFITASAETVFNIVFEEEIEGLKLSKDEEAPVSTGEAR